MTWDIVERDQKIICQKYNVDWTPVDRVMMVAINKSLFTSDQPINGLRHPKDIVIDGWYMWSGDNYTEDKDFFAPLCVDHLLTQRPIVLKYLGLPPGWRFQIDDKGYEDVWFEDRLLQI